MRVRLGFANPLPRSTSIYNHSAIFRNPSEIKIVTIKLSGRGESRRDLPVPKKNLCDAF
jgi:hypothetical protein